MKELKHFKENKEIIDYIIVKDKSLKKETIKPLKKISYEEDKTLETVIEDQSLRIDFLERDIRGLEKEIKDLKALIKHIEGGLNLRWKNC